MKIKLSLLFLFTIAQICCAQNCDFEIWNLSKQLNGEVIIIQKSEYEEMSKVSERLIELIPMTEEKVVEKYPTLFKRRDSCYTFRANPNVGIGISAPELKACKNRVQTKQYTDYKFKGVYSNNALIEVIMFEGWGFLSVDLKTGLTFFTMGKPLTSNGETVISYSNYYGDEEIALTDLKTKKQYVISIDGWTTEEFKLYQNTYYFKLKRVYNTDCEKEIKYIKVRMRKE